MATSLVSKGLIAASDKVIIAAQPAMELVKLFATDFSPDAARLGDTVNMKVLKATAADFASGSQNYVTSTNTISFADIKLNKDKISVFTLADKDNITDDLAPIWDRLAPTAGRAIGKAFVQDVAGLLTVAAADKTITNAAASFADFAKLRSGVEGEGYDPADTVLVLTPSYYDALISFLPNSVVGEGGVVNSGLIGARLGFKAIVNAPNITGAAVGYAVPTDAIAIASRYKAAIKEGGNLLEAGYAVDEETGLVIGTRVVANTDDGEYNWSAEALYGVALAKQNGNGAPGFLAIANA